MNCHARAGKLEATAAADAECAETLSVVERRLAALAEAERELRMIHAQLILAELDETVDRAQLRAEALKAQASVLLGLDDLRLGRDLTQ